MSYDEGVDGSAKVTFGYDAEARLTEADTWTPDGAGGWTLANTTRFAWDGTNLIGEFDGSNNLLRSFAWGPTGLLEITDLTGPTPVTYVPVKDATGSIVQLLDTNGNVVADYHYDAWGVRTAAGPAAGACPFGFAGMLMDPTTGLYYDNARWYSAPQGRFLTPDPTGAAGGLNLNAYCGNDPVNQADPTGLDPKAGAGAYLNTSPTATATLGDSGGVILAIPVDPADGSSLALLAALKSSDGAKLDEGAAIAVSRALRHAKPLDQGKYLTRWYYGWEDPQSRGFALADPAGLASPGLHVLGEVRGPYISMSTFFQGSRVKLPSGELAIPVNKAPSGDWIKARLWYVDKGQYTARVVENAEILKDLQSLAAAGRIHPNRIHQWTGAQGWEGEVLGTADVAPGAIRSLSWIKLRTGAYVAMRQTSRGLVLIAIVQTATDLALAGADSYRLGSPDPLIHEVARQAGGWTGAWAGAEVGGGIGSFATPIGTFIGGLIGGAVGYVVGRQVGETAYQWTRTPPPLPIPKLEIAPTEFYNPDPFVFGRDWKGDEVLYGGGP